jgi:hypothetical protein
MPRFYFHLRDGTDVALDDEGTELSPEQIAAKALQSVRHMIAHAAIEGQIDFRLRVDVEDESGRVVHSAPFAGAVEIVQP